MKLETTLQATLHEMLHEARGALEELHDAAACGIESKAEGEALDDHRETLRVAIDQLEALRRLLDGRTVREIRVAFGPPGDWGYETPLGKALAATYEAPAQPVTNSPRECTTCGWAHCKCDQT